MFTTALLTRAERRKQPKHPLPDDGLKKWNVIYTQWSITQYYIQCDIIQP